MDWFLECSDCGTQAEPIGLPTVCTACGRPWLVRYPDRIHALADRGQTAAHGSMWGFRSFLPLTEREKPVTLGEGDTPLFKAPRLAKHLGLDRIWIKDEAVNPTSSFKARGLSAAITRAALAGVTKFVVPTAGNAGVASAAYAARAGASVRVYAPQTTPKTILAQIVAFGADLVLLEGHIGDCGKAAKAWAQDTGATDLSTLKEPYRIEGKKTLGLEIAAALGWGFPDVILYPTGGGTGLIGMWKAFVELRAAGWVSGSLPRMYSVQSTGCAPIVRAFAAGKDTAEAWVDPWTIASGLRVPGPIGDKLMLRILRETSGGAVAIHDEEMTREAAAATSLEGVDFSPEGGASVAAARVLAQKGEISARDRVVVFNTGAGWLYRDPAELLAKGG